MRKSVKVIIAAVVAASLSLGVVTFSSFAANSDDPKDSGVVWSKSESGDDVWSRSWESEDNEELSAFEQELLDEIRRGMSSTEAGDVPSVADSDTTLKEVPDKDGTRGYKLWTNTITVNNISKYANSYTGPARFTCETDYKKGEMTGTANYKYNYKKVHTRIVFRENDKDVGKNKYSEGTTETVSATVQYSGSGRPVEAAYYFYMYDGTGSGANISEVAVVYVVDQAYAASAEYAQKPYADILDVCTYVDI